MDFDLIVKEAITKVASTCGVALYFVNQNQKFSNRTDFKVKINEDKLTDC